jgi:hypothetical protein
MMKTIHHRSKSSSRFSVLIFVFLASLGSHCSCLAAEQQESTSILETTIPGEAYSSSTLEPTEYATEYETDEAFFGEDHQDDSAETSTTNNCPPKVASRNEEVMHDLVYESGHFWVFNK